MDKKYEAHLCEQEAQKFWHEKEIFKANKNSEEKLFSIDTPPPTISGALHIGHIFSYTQTDIIARFKRLSGYNVFYPFGFDDNGLATERFVEKKHKVSGYHMGRAPFIALCLKESQACEKEFEALWKRMGISADWSETYSTISPLAQKIAQCSFLDLLKKGYIYRKEDPALYCTTCRTALAQADLEDVEQNSTFNDIVFETATGKDGIVSTTRPELLPSCVALFYHPDDSRYHHLKGTTAKVPLFGHEVPVLTDELVEPTKGTGLVMCCTFGDRNDIMWYKKHNLMYRPSVGLDGIWTEATGILAGLKAHPAREKIIEELKAQGLLVNQRPITHAVNVHERCKKEIEFIVLKQWFLNILDHKDHLLKLIDKLSWYPDFMKTRCKDWIQNIQWDWCLSRQRFYGIPFPVWHCSSCNHMISASSDTLPVDPQEKTFTEPCPHCGKETIIPDTDVMDTWNTSSLTPYICMALYTGKDPRDFFLSSTTSELGKEQKDRSGITNFLPMGMRPQAHDIIRTWAFYTIVKTAYHHNLIPWDSIVISGHVLSTDRNKISKSVGNTPTEPEKLLRLYPADVIRFWTASGTLGHDVSFSETQLQIGQKLLTKLWNACKFINEHTAEVQKAEPYNKPLGISNEWLLHQATLCFTHYQQYLEKNEFSVALHTIEQFFWNDFCDNYLELIKDQLFKPELYNPSLVQATRWTLSNVGLRIIQMFAPYIPFITETIYQKLYQKHHTTPSLHLTHFSAVQKSMQADHSVHVMKLILSIISEVRKLKTTQQLSLKTPLVSLTIYGIDQTMLQQLVPQEQLIKGVTQAESIAFETTNREGSRLELEHDRWSCHICLVSEGTTKEKE